MKIIQKLFLVFVACLAAYSAGLHAEDIDIYVDNSATVGSPNVMFIMDNGANFSSSANGTGCTAYSGTSEPPSLGVAKASGILQCALVDALNSLPDGIMRIGIGVSNANSFGETQATTDTTKGGYHALCNSSAVGGCIIRPLSLMNTTNKASLVAFIKGWKDSSTSNADSFNIKVNTATAATAFQEVWAYYNGKIGMSGTSYSPSVLGTGCQKNFVVYIGNTEKNPASESNPDPSASGALGAGQVGATTAQKIGITGTVKFVPSVCGGTSTATLALGNNWADEWARLMYQQDGGASGNANTQNIISYSIGILGAPSQCSVETLSLQSSIAKNGGGKFFMTSSVADLTGALNAVLNEVQAVNSVFSSASLPVSVNAEGSYLNQIYLGMFRPDQTGAPRWMGNLKQYQLVQNASGDTVLGDATGVSAISASGTGFISPTAKSFWTYKNTGVVPDDSTTGGFWVNDKKGVPESGFDSADGEVVEKGGVAQQIRKENMTATFTGAKSSSNPRRLYTYCPAGTGCVAALTDTTNSFTSDNANISSTAFGATTTVRVLTIVRTGTSALVTTNGNHGFSTGTSVTVSGAGQSEYNVTQAITVNSATTFTITGLTDYPTTPSAGTYQVSPPGGGAIPITSVTRATSNSGGNTTELVTVVTSSAHGYTTTSTVVLSGISPANYNLSVTPTAVSTSSFTFSVGITPNATSLNAYNVVISPTAYPALSSVSLTNPSAGNIAGTTTTAHKFHVGQTIIVSNASDGASSKYPGTYTIVTVPTTTTFTATNGGAQPKAQAARTATVSADTSTTKPIAVGKITRAATTSAATALVASGTLPAAWFGKNSGDTRIVNITKASGTSTSEAAYEASNVTITCQNADCTSFSYPISVTPSASISLSGATVALAGATTVNLAAGSITRTAAGIATATSVTASVFTNGQSVNISASGTPLDAESAYVGTWTISCAGLCTSFSFGPVTLTPATPATGSNILAYSSTTPPDKSTVVAWLRGEDNYGDEKGPGGTVKVRPSIHGDVLHSRPLVINYGDAARGIVVFYGSNDGVYRAVNGNQTGDTGSVPPGGELWGLVMPEHYAYVNRLRLNSPELKFPSTILASAQPKDYFVDGPTGSFQKINADGTINTAYIYLTMRRGGRHLYGMNVTSPTAPSVLWRISNGDTGFEELGQTWSRPKAVLVQGGGLGTTPVLVFGAGYDRAEDSEPPGTDSMGRGIFIVNAATGALIWSATPGCTTSATCKQEAGLTHAVPADIATVDRDNNGYTDKLYFGDTGGNLWRVDVGDADTANWTIKKIAALGCAAGAAPCGSGTAPRKFFFPPSVLTIKASGASGSYDVISIASGDREHPLKSPGAGSSYAVADKFFMIKDTHTTVSTPSSVAVRVLTGLIDVTSSLTYTSTDPGFYVSFARGEKGVNAPLAVNGKVFFSTNRPVDTSVACAANLGEAKAYAVNPFSGAAESQVLAGGGLPPSPVSGLVTITKTAADGSTYTEEEKFCIGCSVGCTGATCNVALENTPPAVTIPKNLRRTYWYKK